MYKNKNLLNKSREGDLPIYIKGDNYAISKK